MLHDTFFHQNERKEIIENYQHYVYGCNKSKLKEDGTKYFVKFLSQI